MRNSSKYLLLFYDIHNLLTNFSYLLIMISVIILIINLDWTLLFPSLSINYYYYYYYYYYHQHPHPYITAVQSARKTVPVLLHQALLIHCSAENCPTVRH